MHNFTAPMTITTILTHFSINLTIIEKGTTMKLRFKKEDLNKGLQSVQKIAQDKSNNISYENGLLIKAIRMSLMK